MKYLSPFLFVLSLFLFPTPLQGAPSPTSLKPPVPPSSGPGSKSYQYSRVKEIQRGSGPKTYRLYYPLAVQKKKLPVIVFLRGWSTVPEAYGAWIEHLVKRGNLVLLPYFHSPLTPPNNFADNAIEAIKDALNYIDKKQNLAIDRGKMAIVGHSAGGLTAANVAALAKRHGLPQFRAIMAIQPGRSWSDLSSFFTLPLENFSTIPKDTLLLTVVGEKDRVVKDIDAKKIFYGTTQIPLKNKDYIIFHSDYKGSPPLRADHSSPAAFRLKDISLAAYVDIMRSLKGKGNNFIQKWVRNVGNRQKLKNFFVDAHDYYGYWKLFDGLCDAAFYGKNRAYALGGTKKQKYLGKWSNGQPVKKLTVTDRP